MSKKLGLALGSGGARGVAHIGFLHALDEAGIKPYCIAGCSMGAVVGGCYASGLSAAEIRDVVLSLKPRDILDVSPAIITKMSLLRSKKMRDLLVEYLGKKDIKDLPIKFACVATDLMSGKLHTFTEGNAAKAIQASSTMPTVFRPVKIGDALYIDGGCLYRVPVKTVKDLGADVVVAVDVLSNAAEPIDEVHNIVTMVLRVFDIMDTHQTEQARLQEGDLCDLLLEPEMKGMSQYVIKDLRRAYDEGYAMGKKNIKKIRSLIK